MLNALRQWWHGRVIRRSRITEQQWQQAFARLPLLDRLPPEDRQRLCHLVILLLHKKSFEAAAGLTMTLEMALIIALQACLPILRLGINWYRGWVSIIVYPDNFSPERRVTDEAGVVHKVKHRLSGESWQRGPVILSWRDSYQGGVIDGQNLVIHEFAHKLDMLNGDANGLPPLHRGMSIDTWAEAFSQAFDDFQARQQAGEPLPFDGYAAQSPAEFFAVLSEVFFEQPQRIRSSYPQVHEQLKQFYRQDPSF